MGTKLWKYVVDVDFKCFSYRINIQKLTNIMKIYGVNFSVICCSCSFICYYVHNHPLSQNVELSPANSCSFHSIPIFFTNFKSENPSLPFMSKVQHTFQKV